jgi:AraC-like DNA-binding protein
MDRFAAGLRSYESPLPGDPVKRRKRKPLILSRPRVVMSPMRVTYKPAAQLSAYVDEIWYCDGHGVVPRKERALPTGRFQLFVSLSEAPIGGWGRTNWEVGRGASSLVVGMQTHFCVIDGSTLEAAMGVVFWPGAARAFFDAPADAFYNERVPLDLIWGSLAGEFRDRVREASTPAEKFQAMEAALLARANRRLALHPAVRYALGEFARQPHIRSVLDVAKEAGLSRHRFAQLFREQVGLTPKLYCRLHRFQSVLRQIASGAAVDWADLALAGGYCDQAHLANEFRSFSGISPGSYLASERSL